MISFQSKIRVDKNNSAETAMLVRIKVDIYSSFRGLLCFDE
nr:MAG TPA: hypothetical protein [Caudoviricetes sp.]DAT21660.1 MAG TPA: hypothetical protein [Caudoviricetes sp.]